ncbi:hypothetical protein M8J75_008476 [Diaphorina citri]|nr:hypothetical protein M8J75_004066 [Diaphorina citri]KAI5697313.1 hypothetical protein M8J75_008476 [Diaphorina citri]
MDSSPSSQNSISGPASSTLPAPCTQFTSLTPPVPSHTTPLKRTATQIRNRRRRAAKIRHVARTPVARTSLLRVASSSHCSKPWRSSDNNQYAPYTSSLHATSSSSLRPPYGLFASRNFFPPDQRSREREREATTVATAVT